MKIISDVLNKLKSFPQKFKNIQKNQLFSNIVKLFLMGVKT